MRTFEEIKDTIETGLGKHPCDLKLQNVRLVNVYSSEIYNTDIYIKNGRIISISPEANLEAQEVVECCGQFAVLTCISSQLCFHQKLWLQWWCLKGLLHCARILWRLQTLQERMD